MTDITEGTFGAEPEGWTKIQEIPPRLIGQKEILPVIAEMYHIHTWPGALKFIKSNNLPLRQTPSKKPMFLIHELIQYDINFQHVLNRR